MLNLKRLIEDHEEWLTDRVVEYAQEKSYTAYSSTLREAWRISICGLSKPLIGLIEDAQSTDSPFSAAIDQATEFGVGQGLRHRAMGIGASDFIGMLKLYRAAYLDLVIEKETFSEQRLSLQQIILELFDSMELGILSAWEETTTDERLAELRQKNRELSNEKNRYLTVFESIAEPAILLDINGKPTHVNAAANRVLLGEHTPGAGYYGVLTNPRLQESTAQILGSQQPKDQASGPLELLTPAGKRLFHVAIQEMLDISKKYSGTVIILQDVTEFLKAIEAAHSADRAKSEFLTTLSHEIRTPINNILGLAGLLDDGSFPAQKLRHLRSILASGEILSTLIENYLGLSKVESNALQVIEQDFDLGELCRELFDILELEEFRQKLRLERSIASDIPMRLHGDAHKLRHVLMNLLSNALKFTESGTVTLTVSRLPESESGQHNLRFEVMDTGPGLDQDDLSHLIEPYYQSKRHSVRSKTGGSGLGLAISKHLVEFLGGRIEYNPRPLGGSVFSFNLVLNDAVNPYASVVEPRDKRVLIVEDDPVNAIVFEGYLEELGYVPTTTSSYAEAIEALETETFDIVLTDYRLGGETGLDIAGFVGELSDRTKRTIPIIVVTAAITSDVLESMGHSSVSCFLEKPFSRYELANALLSVSQNPSAPQIERMPVRNEHLNTLDLDRLLSDLGFSRCKAVIENYRVNAAEVISNMNELLKPGDLPAIGDLAHQLVSASSFVGAWRQAEFLERLMSACEKSDRDAASRLVDEVTEEHGATTQDLAAYWHKVEVTRLL